MVTTPASADWITSRALPRKVSRIRPISIPIRRWLNSSKMFTSRRRWPVSVRRFRLLISVPICLDISSNNCESSSVKGESFCWLMPKTAACQSDCDVMGKQINACVSSAFSKGDFCHSSHSSRLLTRITSRDWRLWWSGLRCPKRASGLTPSGISPSTCMICEPLGLVSAIKAMSSPNCFRSSSPRDERTPYLSDCMLIVSIMPNPAVTRRTNCSNLLMAVFWSRFCLTSSGYSCWIFFVWSKLSSSWSTWVCR